MARQPLSRLVEIARSGHVQNALVLWRRQDGARPLKPAPFEYRKPGSLQAAAVLLGESQSDAKILAGGQTLVPMMNFRLACPSVVIDINDIQGLDGIEADEKGLKLGALVRWHQIETSPAIRAANPLLAHAVTHIAHYQIRNRGTWAGSCAHADPAAEFPAVAIVCGAEFGLYSTRGRRTVGADQFFLGPLTTALEPDEILTDATFSPWPAERRWAFDEFALRPGDFAIAGVAFILDGTDAKPRCRLACFGVGEKASRLPSAERVLEAKGLTHDAIAEAAAAAAGEIEAQSDIHASADYRRNLVEVLIERTVRRTAGLEPRYD